MKAVCTAGLALALIAGAGSNAHAYVWLTGTDHMDITTDHYMFHLNDSSSVALLNGGSITFLYAYHTSRVTFDGGSVHGLTAHFLSNAEGVQIDLVNGTINTLYAGVSLEGSDHLIVPQNPTIDMLTPYGLTVSGGTISNMVWQHIIAYDSSRVEIAEGSFGSLTLKAYDSGSIAVGGGSVEGIHIYNNGSATVGGGSVGTLNVFDSGSVIVDGGSVGMLLANNSSSAFVGGGSVNMVRASGDSSAFMNDGIVNFFLVSDNGSLDIGGGTIGAGLHVADEGLVTVRGYDFELGPGLSLDGNILTGTGLLSGKWYDTSEWSISIGANADTATILLETFVAGDFNGDGVLSGLDIPGFKTALADPDGWASANPDRPHPNALGDFNGDSVFSGLDIPGFKTALAGGAAAIPEPATALVLLVGATLTLKRRRA